MMPTRFLGHSDIQVSQLCLGTMTWGSQNSEAEGHAQLDCALEHGINFIDTAEMYPTTPLKADTCGETERITGTWLAKSGKRSQVVVATKVVGNGFGLIRDGGPITPKVIRQALEGSLRRLQTDYVDLYQLHWPNRGSYHFRRNWQFDPSQQDTEAELALIQENLQTLDALIREGKIRSIGLSNETAWGTMQYLRLAAEHDLPRVVSVQNEYSLMCRHYDLDMAELSHHENVGLLTYSSLAAGLLTGKYRDGQAPPGSRASLNADLHKRLDGTTLEVANAYTELAEAHGLSATQLALAFCMKRPFVTSVILGATSVAQLEQCISAARVELSSEVLQGIAALQRRYPMPF